MFSSTVTTNTPSSCKNNTGVQATPFSGSAATRIANESDPNGAAQGNSGSVTSSGSSPSSTSSHGAAMPLQTASWGVLGAAVVGGIAMM